MKTSNFDYYLPENLIAQEPISPRDHSRLMILNREKQTITHDYFYNLPQYLSANDVLVFNESKVIPARLFGQKSSSGKVEILLVKQITPNIWECLTKPGLKIGATITFSPELKGKINDVFTTGIRIIEFNQKENNFIQIIKKIGHAPTPPYIKKPLHDQSQYQTIYAKNNGSVAAPTAGFHFTNKLFTHLREKGIMQEFLTLHVGLGTFQPIKVDKVEDHIMHSEWFSVEKKIVTHLNKNKKQRKNIVAVGTTATRALESTVIFHNNQYLLQSFSGETSIFIYPGYQFKFVNKLITNFHLPKSTLLMLVSAFAGQDFIRQAYEEAIKNKYRFYSFGDGMLIE